MGILKTLLGGNTEPEEHFLVTIAAPDGVNITKMVFRDEASAEHIANEAANRPGTVQVERVSVVPKTRRFALERIYKEQ